MLQKWKQYSTIRKEEEELENMEGEEKAVNDPTPEIDLSNVEW